MRRLPSRRLAAALAMPLLVVSLAACGGDDAEPTSSSSDASSGSEDDSEGDSGDDGSLSAGDAVSDAELSELLSGAQMTKETVHFSMNVESEGQKIVSTGAMDPRGAKQKMSMTMELGGQQVEAVLIGDTMFMAFGPDQWMRQKMTAEQVAQSDPTKTMEPFLKAVKSAEFIGEESIDGEDVRHFQAVLDAEKLDQEGTSALGEDLGMDFYIDDEGRMTLMTMESDAMSMEFDFFDWGAPVSIKAPPKNQIVEVPAP